MRFLALSVIPHAMPSYIELRTRKETFAFKLVRYPICVCSLIQTAFFLCLLTIQYVFRTVKLTGSLKDLNCMDLVKRQSWVKLPLEELFAYRSSKIPYLTDG